MNCEACFGFGRTISFQPTLEPVALVCAECAGSGLTPACFDNDIGETASATPHAPIPARETGTATA